MGAPVPAVDMICQQNDTLPSSSNVEDYIPAELEYLPVDYLKAKCPALGTSQTPAMQPASNTACKSLHSFYSEVQLNRPGCSSIFGHHCCAAFRGWVQRQAQGPGH
jgi:hypothetical protein